MIALRAGRDGERPFGVKICLESSCGVRSFLLNLLFTLWAGYWAALGSS